MESKQSILSGTKRSNSTSVDCSTKEKKSLQEAKKLTNAPNIKYEPFFWLEDWAKENKNLQQRPNMPNDEEEKEEQQTYLQFLMNNYTKTKFPYNIPEFST